MSSKQKSRWADDEADLAHEAQRKREKEEKRRLKAEKQRKLEEEERQRQQREAAAAAAAAQQAEEKQSGPGSSDQAELDTNGARPSKRRRLSPTANGEADQVQTAAAGTKLLLRPPQSTWAPCRSVEDFEKLNDIEEGAYGWVSRARDERTGKVVALKRLKMENGAREGIPVTGLREMQILMDCEHRNVVKLLEVVVGEDTEKIENIFLVMDFLEHDLKTLLEAMSEPFLPSETKTLLQQLTSGLSYLHDNWILHRDLKTSNLLLSNRGILKIADFGMARYIGDPPLGQLTQLVVTLWYRSPELLLGTTSYGRAVDMWSVGCIFGELLTREPLFQGTNEVSQLARIFELCGLPHDTTWPGFRRLPNARSLRLPPRQQAPHAHGAVLRAKFPFLTKAGGALLTDLLSLNPDARPTAKEVLDHAYFREDPRPKSTDMFPTFPSKAGLEKRRRNRTPNAPQRGQAPGLEPTDFSGIFAGREDEVKGAGFELRLV